jgi:hypothetical protein
MAPHPPVPASGNLHGGVREAMGHMGQRISNVQLASDIDHQLGRQKEAQARFREHAQRFRTDRQNAVGMLNHTDWLSNEVGCIGRVRSGPVAATC